MKVNDEARQCLNCNSTMTYLHKGKHEDWYHYKDGYICHKCYHKLISNPITHAKWNQISHSRRLVWTPENKRIQLNENPRTGQCHSCAKSIGDEYVNHRGQVSIIKQTAIHHFEYHANDPLKDTIELCASCHGKETRRFKNKNIPISNREGD